MAFGDIIRSAASPQEFPRGIGGNANTIWHSSLSDPKNYELSVSDFSVIRQANAPDTKPTDIGGDSDKVWHCDYQAQKVYELSSSDLSVVRTSSSPGTWPSGIGGYSSKIWYGDSDENKVYELSTSDFGVIRSETAPGIGDRMWGIGGSGSVIWFKSGFYTPNVIRIYKLSVEDFSVLHSVEAPTSHPGGLGGDDGVIWYCNYGTGEKKVYELESSIPPSAPTGLLCNDLTNPVDIVPQYFSAVYNDPNSGDIAKHYRIRVNKESDFSGQVVWDSGKTSMSDVNEGERCANIDYNGRGLSLDKTKYYWQIKFWDTDGNEGEWSSSVPYPSNFTMAGCGSGEMGSAPWDEEVLEPSGEAKVEIPRRSGQWTTLGNVMRIHTSRGKDTSSPRAPIEIGQAEVTCSNIDRDFNSFEEASDWYKQLEGYAVQIWVGCKISGTPITCKIFTGIISSVDADRLSLTAEIRVVDFLDYFGRVTIEETPVWENISLTQLFKNLVELAFPEWVEGTDYFVEDLGGSTIPAIGYTDLNLLSELKMIAISRGKRLYTDVNGKLVCRGPD